MTISLFSVVSQVASLLITSGVFFIFAFTITLLLVRLWIQYRAKWLLPHLWEGDTTHTIAFFHPYCNASGGGERVLWTAIRAIQKRYCNVLVLLLYFFSFFKVFDLHTS